MTRARASVLWLLCAAPLLVAGSSFAAAIEVAGRVLYQDRLYDADGYTGTTQDLPVRRADVEVVAQQSGLVLAAGSTDANGEFRLTVDLLAPTNLYVRCLTATEYHPDYHILVVDRFTRVGGQLDLSQAVIHSVVTPAQLVDPLTPASGDFGEHLVVDETGFGVAQTFNVLDNAIDSFDYLATAEALGRYPTADEFVVYGWNFTNGSNGSNYASQGIYLTSRPTDTDAWSDTVVLHETGHWVSDLFSADDNTGGAHFIGDNHQDPRLSYGEGYPTFFCGQVRAYRASRLGELGQPIDGEITVYADLGVPPPLPDPGGLEFSYDFETGLAGSGVPLGQIGTANETNVTSVMWDLVDGPDTPDGSAGDDDAVDSRGDLAWEVLLQYLPPRDPVDWITVEDFHDGWFVRHGANFLRPELDEIFVQVGQMPLAADEFEPDDTLAEADPVVPLIHLTNPGGKIVITEIGVDPDRIELYNAGETPVNMMGWKITTYRNGLPNTNYFFPTFTLYSGAFVTVHAGGDTDDNGPTRLFDPNFLVFWIPEDDGACAIANASNVAVDFLRWDNLAGGDPSLAPIPSGLSWSGSLPAAPRGQSLGRDKDGTDTDQAGDWVARPASFGAPNFDELRAHTIYPQDDRDLVVLDLAAGDLVTLQAVSPHSAGRPAIELLSADGVPSGEAFQTYGLPDLAELQLLAPVDTTIYARVTNRAEYTEYAPVQLAVFARPSGQLPAAPSGFVVTAAHENDLSDTVQLTWLNGGIYDQIEVHREGALLATLAGDARTFDDFRPRGLYTYAVRGILGTTPTEFAQAIVFAGTIPCHSEEGFEAGAGNLVLESPWTVSNVLASQGSFALTESPGGNYLNNLDITAELIEPADLVGYTTLEFDHICATEPGYDFGIVEISTNFGTSWEALAQYDGDDHPGWIDGDADPEDWIHESIDISSYVGETVRVRFRFTSDGFVVEDGWFVDDVRLSEALCESVTSVPEDDGVSGDGAGGDGGGPGAWDDAWSRLAGSHWLAAGPNPTNGPVLLAVRVPSGMEGAAATLDLIDVAGRRVRELFRGPLERSVDAVWDGRDESGEAAPAGVYFARLRVGGVERTVRIVRVE